MYHDYGWDEDCEDSSCSCSVCDKTTREKRDATNVFQELVDNLYKEGEFDIDHIDNIMDMLGSYFEVNVPKESPLIQRGNSE